MCPERSAFIVNRCKSIAESALTYHAYCSIEKTYRGLVTSKPRAQEFPRCRLIVSRPLSLRRLPCQIFFSGQISTKLVGTQPLGSVILYLQGFAGSHTVTYNLYHCQQFKLSFEIRCQFKCDHHQSRIRHCPSMLFCPSIRGKPIDSRVSIISTPIPMIDQKKCEQDFIKANKRDSLSLEHHEVTIDSKDANEHWERKPSLYVVGACEKKEGEC